MPALVCQPLYCATVHFKALYCKIENVFFFCVWVFRIIYYLHKNYKHITAQYCTAYCVGWVPWLTLLDLLTCSQNGTHSYVGDLLYSKMIVSFVCIRNRNVFAIKGKCHKKVKRKRLRGDKSPSRQPQENPLLTSSTPVGAVKGEVS